jgi:gas vesicle protein
MSEQTNQTRDYRFVAGLALGSIVGVGLTMLLAPRAAAEIKERAVGSAKQLGDAVRDGVLDSVVLGAQKVERAAQGLRRVPTDAPAEKAV